jgi:hypothetical protein
MGGRGQASDVATAAIRRRCPGINLRGNRPYNRRSHRRRLKTVSPQGDIKRRNLSPCVPLYPDRNGGSVRQSARTMRAVQGGNAHPRTRAARRHSACLGGLQKRFLAVASGLRCAPVFAMMMMSMMMMLSMMRPDRHLTAKWLRFEWVLAFEAEWAGRGAAPYRDRETSRDIVSQMRYLGVEEIFRI